MGDSGRLSEHTFKMTPDKKALFTLPEQPNEKITVRISLKSVSLDLKDLNRRLSTNDMKASRDEKNKNTIVVRGIPYNGYGAQNILAEVQNFDKGASIIR